MKKVLVMMTVAAMLPLQSFAQDRTMSDEMMQKISDESQKSVCENISTEKESLSGKLNELKQLEDELEVAKNSGSSHKVFAAVTKVSAITAGVAFAVVALSLKLPNRYFFSEANKIVLIISAHAGRLGTALALVSGAGTLLTVDQIKEVQNQMALVRKQAERMSMAIQACE